MDERNVLLYKFGILRASYPNLYIHYNINDSIEELRYQYLIAFNRTQEYRSQYEIDQIIYKYNTYSIMCLEILCCKITDLDIKYRIRQVQRSHNWTITLINNSICEYGLL